MYDLFIGIVAGWILAVFSIMVGTWMKERADSGQSVMPIPPSRINEKELAELMKDAKVEGKPKKDEERAQY